MPIQLTTGCSAQCAEALPLSLNTTSPLNMSYISSTCLAVVGCIRQKQYFSAECMGIPATTVTLCASLLIQSKPVWHLDILSYYIEAGVLSVHVAMSLLGLSTAQ